MNVSRTPGGVTTATILFTDIVDSTVTRVTAGEEVADRVFARHDRLLRSVVRVHRVAFVNSVGDGIMAVFDSATDALKAAAAIEHAVAAENQRNPVPVEIRAGISSGDIVWTADDVQGLPIVEAARLAATADRGRVQCSEVSVRLAFGREGMEFKEVGWVHLKGIDQPLHAFELLWWQQAPPTAVLPGWLRHKDLLPFVGRDREAATLNDWLSEPTPGPRLTIVSGAAGVGKTRLVAEVVDGAIDAGHLVLVGRCTDPATRPFQAIAEAIERLAATAPTPILQIEPDAKLSDLVRLAPELTNYPFDLPEPPPADPDTQYFRLIGALTLLLDRLSAITPIVFLIDDLQWASDATIRLLIAVLRQLGTGPVQVIATVRESQVDLSPDLGQHLKGLLALPRVNRLEVGPLGLHDIAAALSSACENLDADVDAVAERVAEMTGGNAFLVTETIRELRSGAALDAVALVDTIALFMSSRVDRAGPIAQDVIHLVAGAEVVEASILRYAVDVDEREFVAALEVAVDTGLVVEQPDGAFAMAHELARAAIIGRLSNVRVAAIHRRLAAALVAAYPSIATTRPYLLAGHLAVVAQFGTPEEMERARDAAVQAARHATARLAHQEAVKWYQRSVELHDRLEDGSDERRAELILALGEAKWQAGDRTARETLVDAGRRAIALGRTDLVVAAALAGNRGFFSTTAIVDRDLIDILSTALTVVSPDALATRAELMACLAAELTWAPDGDRRFALSDEALALARQSGDPRTLVTVLALRNLTISAADTLQQRVADSDELIQTAGEMSDDLLRFHAVFQRAGPVLELGDTAAINGLLDEAGLLAKSLAQPQLHWLVEFSRAGLNLMLGDLAAAEATAERALQLGALAGRRMEAVAFYSEQLAEIRRLQGRLGELTEAMRAIAPRLLIDPVHAVLRYLCEAGVDEVDQLFDQAVATRGLPPRRDLAQRAALDNLAYVAARLQRREAQHTLYDALVPFADTFGHSAVAHPCGHHYLAVLASSMGQPDTAVAHFAAAAALHERAQTPLLLAESLIEWIELLTATGASAEAIVDLRDRAARALAGRDAELLDTRLARSGG